MNKTKRRTRTYEIDDAERAERRQALRPVKHFAKLTNADGEDVWNKEAVYETSIERAENDQVVVEAARAFVATVEFYKTEQGGAKPHDEAVKESLAMNEWRRKYVEGLQPEKVEWSHIAAVGDVSMDDSLTLWRRVRKAADDELFGGLRTAKVIGDNADPYERAQFLAIRDQFADQWKPQGGIESAMVDMLAISFSLQLYWSTVAHQRVMHIHDDQIKERQRYDRKGWKSPHQAEADAIDQAHRLADGYNRQFLRVLRQLRDLRRYAPVVIQNNGGQVNVAADGGQQVNASNNA